MTSDYIRHQYSVNTVNPWNSNRTNSSSSRQHQQPSNDSSLLDGDEELLIMDPILDLISDDHQDHDFCRCVRCSNNNVNVNGPIAVISDGSFSHFNIDGDFEPSDSFRRRESQASNHVDQVDAIFGHDWSNHCHPIITGRSFDSRKDAQCKLRTATVLCMFFMLAEFIVGYISGSLAVMTDAAHLLSDLASFVLSMLAIWFAKRPATKRMSFGYHRAEVLGAVISIIIIWILTGFLIYFAIGRLIQQEFEIDADWMIGIAGAGVAVNIIMGVTLSSGSFFGCGSNVHAHSHGGHGHGHSHGGQSQAHGHGHGHSHGGHSQENMNVRAAMIHVLGDLIQSVAVLISAYIIKYKPEWKLVDPICTFIFSLLVLYTTTSVMKDAVIVLMEGFPQDIEYNTIKECLERVDGVKMVHGLHIWSLTMDRNAMAVHLAVDNRADIERVLRLAEKLVRKDFPVDQMTIQVERFDARTMLNCKTCEEPSG